MRKETKVIHQTKFISITLYKIGLEGLLPSVGRKWTLGFPIIAGVTKT